MISTTLLTLSIFLGSALADAPIPTNGFCASYIIQGGDTCALIAQSHSITEADIEAFNTQTWAWLGCSQLYQGDFICLSAGEPPMPMALPNAVCGPQIPGSMRPTNWADLGSLMPCPAGQCCATWGQCGVGADYCDTKARKPPAGITATVSAATAVEPPATTLATQVKADTGVARETEAKITAEATTATTKATTQSTTQATTKETTKTTTSSSSTTTAASDTFKNTDEVWIDPPLDQVYDWTTPWEITWYENKDCEGDYYHMEGFNEDQIKDDKERCLSLSDGLNSIWTQTNVTCKFWAQGGYVSTKCSAGTFDKPQSWTLKNGWCTAYNSDNCDCFDHYTQLYGPQSCRNRNKFDPPTFSSFTCQRN